MLSPPRPQGPSGVCFSILRTWSLEHTQRCFLSPRPTATDQRYLGSLFAGVQPELDSLVSFSFDVRRAYQWSVSIGAEALSVEESSRPTLP